MADLIKVTFEYTDGTKKYLDGEELEKWERFNAIIAQFARIHGVKPSYDEIKWRKHSEKHY